MLKHWKILLPVVVLMGMGACWLTLHLCNRAVEQAAAGRCYENAADVPTREVAVVMGCSPRHRGRPNAFFHGRIQAAVELYRAGKVKALIVSGDNGQEEYDEPTEMKAALVAQGVPEEKIYCDYAGFRTLDSVVRAEAIFGQKQFTIISQRFHNERALYLAQAKGLDAVAFNAPDAHAVSMQKAALREALARVQAVLDVKLLATEPRFYGPPVSIVLK